MTPDIDPNNPLFSCLDEISPVLFIMMSGHFPSTFGHPWNWAILAALSIISAIARHYFNMKNITADTDMRKTLSTPERSGDE